jgi:hypothetical protein
MAFPLSLLPMFLRSCASPRVLQLPVLNRKKSGTLKRDWVTLEQDTTRAHKEDFTSPDPLLLQATTIRRTPQGSGVSSTNSVLPIAISFAIQKSKIKRLRHGLPAGAIRSDLWLEVAVRRWGVGHGGLL